MFELLVSLLLIVFGINPVIHSENVTGESVTDQSAEVVLTEEKEFGGPAYEVGDRTQDTAKPKNSEEPTASKTHKETALNTQSEKIIDSVAKRAVEKSPVLIPVTPTPTPTPEPEPTISLPVKPIDPPIVIPEPTVHPVKPPFDPCYCPPGQFCIMIACPDVM